MHEFSPKFQDVSTVTGSRAELVLEGIWQQMLLWQCLKYFLVLNFSIEKGELLNQCYYSYIFISGHPKPGVRDYETSSIRAWGCACVCAFVTLLNQAYISFIYEDIFTKFAENVYGCNNMSVKNSALI